MNLRSAMPSLLLPRSSLLAGAECELLSLKLHSSHNNDQQQQQQDKLNHIDKEADKLSVLNDLAASYVPPVSTSFERSASHPASLSASSSFSSLSCLSLVSSFFDRSSSFRPSLPRSSSGLIFSSSLPAAPPPSATVNYSSDESDCDCGSDGDDCFDYGVELDVSSVRLRRAADEVELLEYSKPAARNPSEEPLPISVDSAERTTSRSDADGSSRPISSSSRSHTTTNTIIGHSEHSGLLGAWHSELSCHIRQREADRRKKRRTLRSSLLIDDDECCNTQLSEAQLTLTTRYRHMMLTVRISNTQPHCTTAPPQPSSDLSVSADIYLPLLSSTFASYLSNNRRPLQSVKSMFSFGLTQSASFSSTHEAARRSPHLNLTLQPCDSLSHPLARSSSSVGFVQSRLSTAATLHTAPPILSFIRSQLWPLMLDFMQPATHEQTVPHTGQSADSEAVSDESTVRRQKEACEARLAEREKRWEDEIRRMEERDRRQSGKENRAADVDRRRGRQRERDKTDSRQARPRKRTMDA